jgi:ribose transport system ATP-binding protein
VGAGRTELARSILGYGRITAGEIRVNGQPAHIRSMNEALENYRIGYVSEDRKGEGLLLADPVRDNIAMTIWRAISKILGFITPGAEAKAAGPFVDGSRSARRRSTRRFRPCRAEISKVSSRSGSRRKPTSSSSTNPPSASTSRPRSRLRADRRHRARRRPVLLITSDMAEMVTLADRFVLHDFSIVGEIASDHRYEGTSAAS